MFRLSLIMNLPCRQSVNSNPWCNKLGCLQGPIPEHLQGTLSSEQGHRMCPSPRNTAHNIHMHPNKTHPGLPDEHKFVFK